jgi:hypothetical protein
LGKFPFPAGPADDALRLETALAGDKIRGLPAQRLQ